MNDTTQPIQPLPQTWPRHHTVATLPGSLPMGGVVQQTPIHAFESTPSILNLADRPELRPQRRDIPLGDLLAFMIENVVADDEADAITMASERFGYLAAAPGISTPPGMRMNKTVHWVSDDALLDRMFARIHHLLPPAIDGAPLHDRFSHRINMYRYDADDAFNRHTDGDWPGFGLSSDRREMVEWPGLRSSLTMLLYLNGPNDGVQGGSTRLYDHHGSGTDVTPRKGSALFFRHGFGAHSVMHQGCRVTGSMPKYVARINVLYRPSAAIGLNSQISQIASPSSGQTFK